MENKRNFALGCKGIAAAVALTCAGQAFAYDFDVGDWKGSWTSSFSVGSSFRAHDPSPALVGATGPIVGITPFGKNTTDEGNINYGKGDAFTTLAKIITEVEMKNGDMGFLLRGKVWYDYTLKQTNTKYGNEANGYSSHTPLNDSGLAPLNKYSGSYLLDAYVYDTFQVGGESLQVRVGNQVVNWGEALFIQGVNYINPIDVPSYHKPGAQLKEVFLPVPILYANQSLGKYGSLEAFYQWKFVPTPLSDLTCGSYWGVAQANIGTNQGKCQNSASLLSAFFTNPGVAPGGLASFAAQTYIPGIRGPEAKDSGNYGLAYHFNSAWLDTEFGIYAENVTQRTPVVGAQFVPGAGGVIAAFQPTIAAITGRPTPAGAAYPGNNGHPNAGPLASTIAAFWEYPEDVKVYGVSAATVIGGWSTSFELSQKRDYQVQIDGNDLLGGCLVALGPMAEVCRGAMVGGANAASGRVHGGTKANLTQFQINTLNAGQGILGAGQWILVGEVGAQRNNLADYRDSPNNTRYNRGFVFGAGANPLYGPLGCTTGAPGSNTTPAQNNKYNCANDGYVTPFSWGYRVLAYQTYSNLFWGVTMIPQVFWSHDVKGYAADSAFIEGRQTLGLSVKFSYNKMYALEFGSTMYNHKAHYDALRDRDFYSATFSVNF